MFTYRDQAANAFLDALRWSVWLGANGAVGWWLLQSTLSWTGTAGAFAGAALIITLLVRWKFKRWHSIEIHPDGMIADGRFFTLDAMGEQWPQLQPKSDNGDRLVLSGVYGTRFIEFCTANRLGRKDRSPERLAEDLEMAMEQLWGRRDAFAPAAHASEM
ncbi:hypothetical protein GCM10007857_32420 [Bradyrhizobium iriomotense]|uniref:DUF2244 domain-containing protein n=2 Tax=Bradyrhizobium iriomotense TaxID=441950 RepID=A0ABQ6AYC4_9BRAD|nr:hypothetical protein GCM10007857_32420 [Bradyrhizobium iriomotense]